MDSDGEDRGRGEDSWFGGNTLVIIAGICAVGLLAILLMANWDVVLLNRADMLRLVEASKAGGGGSIVVDVQNKRIRYSRIHDVQLGKYAVSGKIDVEYLDPEGAGRLRKDVTFHTDKLDTQAAESSIRKALEEAAPNVNYNDEGGPDFWKQYGIVLVVSAIILVMFYVMLRRLAGSSALSFGRSRGRLYAQDDVGITFDDVAGIDEAVEEVREVVDFLKSPAKYQKLGGRIPKGVLLVGPPGTGKTLLAKAIAGEAGVPFFSLSGSDFVEMFVGVGAARVRDLFQQAEAKAPTIIFIDELDALGKSRGASPMQGHDEREQTLNALLVEMDGFSSNAGVIVVAASNRPEMLDPALMRPGRFDRQVLVDRPDVRGREAILKVHVKNVKIDETVDLRQIASICVGFVGADLANLVNEAALLAARKNLDAVTMKEFNEGIERVTAGLEKKQRVIGVEVKRRVAFHESAHALVAFSLPNTDPVHKVSIIPRGLAALGYTMQRPEGDRYLVTQAELESQILVLLAGTVAEELIFDDISTGAQNDLQRSTEIARGMVMEYGMSRLGRISYRERQRSAFLVTGPGETHKQLSEHTAREIDLEVKRIVDESIVQVRHILEERHQALVALSERLMIVESIEFEELRKIVDENTSGPMVVPRTSEKRKKLIASAPPMLDSLGPQGGIAEGS